MATFEVETRVAKQGKGRSKDVEVEETLNGPVVAKGTKAGAKGATRVTQIAIPALELADGYIPIIGTSPLIVNNFSEKSKKQMLDAQKQVARVKKAPKDPEKDFLGSLYIIDGEPKIKVIDGKTCAVGFRPGFPANAVKLAAVSACASIEGIFKTEARAAFHVLGYMLEILDPKTGKPAIPHMREDVVRLAGPRPVADIRFRGCFDEWMIKVPVRYNTRTIDLTRIAHLLNTAGFGVGLGEWRSERDGNNGMFEVKLG